MTTRNTTLLAILLTLLALSSGPVHAGEFVSFPEHGVRIVPPPGFERTADGVMLQEVGGRAQIKFESYPVVPDAFNSDFDEEGLKAMGYEQLERERIPIHHREALLIRCRRAYDDGVVGKLVLILGDHTCTLMATAMFDHSRESELLPVLRASLLSIRKGLRPRVRIRGTDLTMIVPPDFAPSDGFTGFLNEESGAHIMVSTLPGPYREVLSGLSAERMRAAGMKCIQRKEKPVGDCPGTYLKIYQEQQGIRFAKHLLVFGDARHTVMVNGILPETLEDRMSLVLLFAVESVREGSEKPDPLAELPFKVEIVAPLEFACVLSGAAMFSTGGRVPLARPGDPMFIVAPSVGVGAVTDRRAAVRKLLDGIAELTGLTPIETIGVKIDGLPGMVTRARAKHAKTGEVLTIYHAVLFREKGYYRMLGRVRMSMEDELVPVFEKMVRSFQVR